MCLSFAIAALVVFWRVPPVLFAWDGPYFDVYVQLDTYEKQLRLVDSIKNKLLSFQNILKNNELEINCIVSMAGYSLQLYENTKILYQAVIFQKSGNLVNAITELGGANNSGFYPIYAIPVADNKNIIRNVIEEFVEQPMFYGFNGIFHSEVFEKSNVGRNTFDDIGTSVFVMSAVVDFAKVNDKLPMIIHYDISTAEYPGIPFNLKGFEVLMEKAEMIPVIWVSGGYFDSLDTDYVNGEYLSLLNKSLIMFDNLYIAVSPALLESLNNLNRLKKYNTEIPI